MRLKTFQQGGVHPHECKLSAETPITSLPPAPQTIVPLSQHLGAPAVPVVERGATVVVGQLLAKASGFISANVHAPVSGTISKIDNAFDASGYKRTAFIIETDGDTWDQTIDNSPTLRNNIQVSREEIIKKVQEAGIVGMGGATFPTHVKLQVPKGKKADMLIINGVECEPYLTADHRLMIEQGEELMVGIRLIMKALDVNTAIIGIEANKPDAIEYLTQLTEKQIGITVQPLQVKYPQGGEKQLIKAITGREVPSGGLPIDVGVIVHNVGTTVAVYEAVQKNKPLIERIVTVTGPSVAKPVNIKARIGTPVSQLIESAGGLPGDTGKIILGGPMMGKAINILDIPVTKSTSGILILPEPKAHRLPTEPCIRCSKCISVCPMGLEPYLLMPLAEHKKWERAEKENIMDCIECGSCSFTCPAHRPLLDYIRLGKMNVGQMIRNRKQTA